MITKPYIFLILKAYIDLIFEATTPRLGWFRVCFFLLRRIISYEEVGLFITHATPFLPLSK